MSHTQDPHLLPEEPAPLTEVEHAANAVKDGLQEIASAYDELHNLRLTFEDININLGKCAEGLHAIAKAISKTKRGQA